MEYLQELAIGLAYLVLGVVALLVAKIIKDWLTPYRIKEHLTQKDNPALGVTLAGYFAGVMIVFLGAVVGPDIKGEPTFAALLAQMGIDFAWAIGGIVALNLGRWVLDHLILTRFSTAKEIIEDRNIGMGAVEAGSFIATGLIVAGAISGVGGGILSAMVFFVLGQATLIAFTWFYQRITRYDVHEQIEQDNVAAGLALSMSMVAIAIIVLKGTAGDFFTWGENLTWFGIYAAGGFVLLLILRSVTDALFLPGANISNEIAVDRNTGAAWIEGVIAMSIAVLVFVLM